MPPKRRRLPPNLPSSVFTFPPVQPVTTTTINNPVKNENDVEITTKIKYKKSLRVIHTQ